MNLKFDVKNNFAPVIVTGLAALLTIVATIFFFITAGNNAYPIKDSLCVVFVILVLIFNALIACLSAINSESILVKVLAIASIVMSVVVFGIIISNRILAIAGIMSYDAGKAEPIKAVVTGITSLVLYLVSAILLAVSSYLGRKTSK